MPTIHYISRYARRVECRYRRVGSESRAIKVDKAAAENYLFLILCQRSETERYLFICAVGGDDICVELGRACRYDLADIRDVQNIAEREGALTVAAIEEGEHAPIDEVAAIALCCVFAGDIAVSAEYALAGGCLLTRRAVSGLYSIYGAAAGELFGCCLTARGGDVGDSSEYFVRGCCAVCRLCSADIAGVLTGECELCKTERIGAVGRGLS